MYIPTVKEYLSSCLKGARRVLKAKELRCESHIPGLSEAEYKHYKQSYETMRVAYIKQHRYHTKRELDDV